jgi:hypothetical protein
MIRSNLERSLHEEPPDGRYRPASEEAPVPTTVHSIEAIEALLRRGVTPKTDNRDALIELGFVRSSPAAAAGYDESLWERSVDHKNAAAGGPRVLVRERAILEPPELPLS